MKNIYLFLIFFILFSFQEIGLGQVESSDTSANNVVHLIYSEIGEGVEKDGIIKRLLYGNVIMRQDSMYMYCDTASLINNVVDAFGHVVISQGDTLNIWSDSLRYVGDEKVAYLKDSVVLKNKYNFLYTEALTYDAQNKIATYNTFSRLTNDTVYVMSKRGVYDLNLEMAYLKDSVFVDGEDFYIKTDSMNYDVKNKNVVFISKTLIFQDSSKIYCEKGNYNINERKAYFTDNAQFQKGSVKAFADEIFYFGDTKKYVLLGDAHYSDEKLIASADTIVYNATNKTYFLNGNAHFKDSTRQVYSDQIVYNEIDKSYSTSGTTTMHDGSNLLIADQVNFDENSDLGIAKGNVVWLDTVQNIKLNCDEIKFNKVEHYYQSYGDTRPWLEWIQDKDTLYISADTILTEGENNKYMKAFNHVKIYGDAMSGLCDSLVYAKEDSMIILYDNPILWMDSTQLVGDTISLIMRENKIDSLRLSQNAFVIDKLQPNIFDQINGKYIDGKLKEGKLRKMFVNKNAQAIYYIRDEDEKYIGVNKSICSKMVFTMGEDKLKSVLFLVAPEFEMIPIKDVLIDPLKLNGFSWRFGEKPLSLDDIK